MADKFSMLPEKVPVEPGTLAYDQSPSEKRQASSSKETS